MDAPGRAHVGGTASWVQAGLYVIAVAAIGLAPGQEIVGSPAEVAAAFLANPWPLRVACAALVVCSLLGLAVVPATVALFPDDRTGWLAFGRNVAVLCLSVTIVYYAWLLSALPGRAALAASRDPTSAYVLAASAAAVPLGWATWFTFGGMGLWVAIVGVLGRRRGVLPRGLAAVCAIKALGFWTILGGALSGELLVTQAGAAAGGLVGGPLYHAWIGLIVRRRASPASAAGEPPGGRGEWPRGEGVQLEPVRPAVRAPERGVEP